VSAAAQAPGVRSALDLLSAWIESQMAYAGLPGLSIGVVHDQALIWSAGFGKARLEPSRPATADTLYRIASITKLFTSTAVLQLRDAGTLRLNPVGVHAFRAETRNGFGGHGEPVVFELGDDGRVRRLQVGDNFLDPVPCW
jgi:hypothetical protein